MTLTSEGAKTSATTGSMSAGSNQITVASSTGFAQGDQVIIAVGGETGAGARGTKGVGGTWPALSYANAAARVAAADPANNTYAWDENTGNVYRYATSGDTWTQQTDYYTAKAYPKALIAEITNISGTTWTLDTTATVATTNANVYFDNGPLLNAIWGEGGSVTAQHVDAVLGSGSFAISERLNINGRDLWILKGAGKNSTTLFTPNGVRSASIIFADCVQPIIRDLHLLGNARQTGFGLDVTETSVPQGSAFPAGIVFSLCSGGGRAQDLKVTDVFQQAIATSSSDDVWAYRVEAILTEPLRQYIQRQFMWNDCDRGGCVDCSVDSAYLTGGFEAFRSSGVQFIRPVSVNGDIAFNTAGAWLLEDADVTVEANSQYNTASFADLNPVISLNQNIDPGNPLLDLGGTIRGGSFIQEGYISASNNVLGILACDVPNITIEGGYPNSPGEGGYYEAPDYSAGSSFGAIMNFNDAEDISIDGIRIVGTPKAGATIGNIMGMTGGSVTNCVADIIRSTGTTLSGNQTNAEYEA